MTLFAHLARPARELTTLGVTLPKQAQNALALADAAMDALTTTAATDLAHDIETGTATPKNLGARILDTATQILAAERAREAATATIEPITRMFRDAIRDNAGDIVNQLRPAFDKAAATVTQAGRHFAPGADARTILAAGPEAAAAWHQLDAAINTLNQIRTARGTLAGWTGSNEEPWQYYVTGLHTEDDITTAVRAATGAGQMFHALTAAGITLHLNTDAEAAAVTRPARDAAAKAKARADEAARAARAADPHSEINLRAAVAAANA